MPNFSLILAPSQQSADHAASVLWHWESHGELRPEYRRPDNGERVRFAPDVPHSLQNLRWNTKVYLVEGWRGRKDASSIMGLLDSGFFVEADPELPPPRPRRKRDGAAIGKLLSLLEQER